MKKIKHIMLAGALSVAGLGIARAAVAPTISGFIDTTYNYDFNKPFNNRTALRSYDAQHNNISLNSAHLAFNGASGNVGYTIETDYGTDAAFNTSAGSGGADDFDVQEAYMTYACPVTGLNLKVGKFVTPEGIEVIESKDNPTISRGYLFGLAEPFTHVGGMLSHALGKKLDVGVGVINGWDQTVDVNNGKTVLGKVGLNLGDPLAVTVVGYWGPEQTNALSTSTAKVDGNNRGTIDVTAVTKLIPKVALWLQYNYGSEENISPSDPVNSPMVLDNGAHWSGFGIQPVVSITDKFSVGLRGEWMEDPMGVRTGGGLNTSISNYTIAPAYKLDENMTVRVEFRADSSNKKLWVDDKAVAKDSTTSATAEFIVTF